MADIRSGVRVRIVSDDHDHAGKTGTVHGRSISSEEEPLLYVVLDDGTCCWVCAYDAPVIEA